MMEYIAQVEERACMQMWVPERVKSDTTLATARIHVVVEK